MSDELPGTEQGVVLHGTGGIWHVRTASGADREASLRGRLKQEGRQDASLKLAVGDRVILSDTSQFNNVNSLILR